MGKNKRKILSVWCCIYLLAYNSLSVWAAPQEKGNDLIGVESDDKAISNNDIEENKELVEVEDEFSTSTPNDVIVGTETENSDKNQQEDVGGTEYTENLTLLFEENTNITEMEEVLHEIDLDYKLTIIEEINLVHIQSMAPIKENDIILNKQMNGQIDDYGVLVPVEQEGMPLDDIEIGEDNVYIENLDSTNEDGELLEILSWHVDDVTNNRESLKVSSGEGIEIALIDSGVDYLHPLLQDKIDLSDAKSYIPTENLVRDTNGHGTMVAGVIAQIAPSATITPYRVISEKDGESLWTIEAIVQAVNDGKQIINMSLGTYKNASDESESLTVKAFERAINYAESKEVILVSSSGNLSLDLDANYEEKSIRHLPGSVEGVLAVSSTTKSRAFASYSNYGSNVQFSAPGGDVILNEGYVDIGEWVYTTYPLHMDNGLGSLGIPVGYTFSIGTSLSAPTVTAGIADFMSYYPKMTGSEPEKENMLTYFQNSALDLGTPGYDRYFGNGLINLYDTLTGIEDCIPPTASLITPSIEIHGSVEAGSLVENISDNRDIFEEIKVYLAEDYSFSELGEKNVLVTLEDKSGNKNTLDGKVVVIDTMPPTAEIRNAHIYQGDILAVDDVLFNIQDNAGNNQVTAEFVKEVDTSELGRFLVNIKLSDQSGNSALLSGEIEVISKEKSKAQLTKANNIPYTGDDANIGIILLGMALSSTLAIKIIKSKLVDDY